MEKFFLSFDDPNTELNFQRAKEKIKDLRKVVSDKSIKQSHHLCASMSFTDQFMVMDADCVLLDNFNLHDDVYSQITDQEKVYIFRARNPVNDLEYGHGGIKIFQRRFFNEESVIDFSTSFKDRLISVKKTLNVHHFNSSPFHAWRTAFRECVKLSSNLILKHSDQLTTHELKQQKEITDHRLTVWCEKFNEVEFVEYVKKGAIQGRDYGFNNSENFDSLMNINNFKWLMSQYDRI
jgi:hypothetical protein